MKQHFILFLMMCLSFVVYAQRNTGINTTNPSSKAALDVHTDGSLKQGILVPRLRVNDTLSIQTGIPIHSKGLFFYDTVNTVYRYWTGSKWQAFGGGSIGSSDWSLNGNTLLPSDTLDSGFKYVGTNSPFPLIFATAGEQRMRISRNGNIGIGMNPTGGIPLSLKSNGLGQVLSIVRSTTGNLFEFRQDADLNAKLQMYDVDGSPTVEFNADPKLFSHLYTSGFGIGNADPKVVLDVAGDFATRPTSIDLSAADSYAALSTKGVSIFYVLGTSPAGAEIHGMADGVPGKHLYITNRFNQPVIFLNQSGDAITSDQIILGIGTTYEIMNGQTAHFIYNGGRWRLVSAPSTTGGSSLTGTGLAGKVAFWTNNTTLGQNTLFHWENASQSLGIGWAAPIAPLHLHVAGNLPIYQAFTNVTTGITPATDGFWVGVNATGTAELTHKEAFPMTFATSNIERMRIASNGNVGIGTNAPTSIVNVVTSAYSPVDVICYNNFTNAPGSVRVGFSRGTIATPLAVQNANNIGEFTFLGYNGTSMVNGAWIRATTTEDWTGTANGTSLSFMTRGNGSTLNSTRMTIDESGNVGIGIGAAATKLEVSGALTLTRTSLPAPANNSTVTVGDNSFLFITTPPTGSNTIILSEGLKAGQLLFIMCTGGAGAISLTDSTSNVLLSSSPYAMGSTDTIQWCFLGGSLQVK